jgi:hypothetical protein
MTLSLKRLRSRTRKLLGLNKTMRRHETLKGRFTGVYETGGWGSPESLSGPGSTLDSDSVRQTMIALPHIVSTYGVRSIADIPCGDFNWMPRFLDAHPDLAYAGYDIVDGLIARNRAAHPTRSFTVLDITSEIPPRADLIFSKDMLNHLLDADVWKAVANMVRSGSPYLMLTSNGVSEPNVDLPVNIGGMSRVLNLRTAPFNFPTPLYDDGYLAVWRNEDLAFTMDRVA